MLSRTRAAARQCAAVCVLVTLSAGTTLGQPVVGASDPTIAKVNGQPIHLSDVQAMVEGLPASAHSMPPENLYPMLLDQLIDGQALVVEAKQSGLDKDPAVQHSIAEAEDRALETALLHKLVGTQVTEAAVRARYDSEMAGKPGEEEVHARHILVPDEATAKQIIAELNKGGDFAQLSKQYSKDPGAAQQGGDLGFFKKGDMVPEFANAAFALQSGQVSQTPVHTQFGWHVIQVVERRAAPLASFENARDDLRQKMIQEAVQVAVDSARARVKVEKFNLDGSPIRATDSAELPPSK